MDELLGLILRSAMPYWAWCASVALGVYGLFLWLERETGGEGALNAELRSGTTLLLLGVYPVASGDYARRFNAMFDRVFATGSPDRFLLRSALASMLAVAAIACLLGPVLGLTTTRGASDLGLMQFLVLGALINILPDFLSLLETRWLLGRLARLRHSLLQLGALILDLILSAAIILAAIRLYHLLRGTAPPSLIETVALFSPYSIFFYSTFLTSAWAWLYFASAATIRLTSGPLSHVLNIERKPFLSLGVLASALAFAALAAAGLALRPTEAEEGGVAARLDMFLCRHFPEDACDHMARLSKDDADLIRRLEAVCEGSALDYCMRSAMAQVGVNDQNARRLWTRACGAGSAAGCTNLGYLHEGGIGGPRDAAAARDLYRQGCDGGNALGCKNLGYLHQTGLGGAQDAAAARKLYRQGCDGGDATGCTNLGYLHSNGLGGAQDAAAARELYRQGCEGGNAMGCTNLGILQAQGIGGAQDAAAARDRFRQGCDGSDARGCTNLGVLSEHGLGGTQDAPAARVLYRQGCDGGDANGCTSLGYLHAQGLGGSQDEATARTFFHRGCDRGEARGCHNLSLLYARGLGGDADPEAAASYRSRACDLAPGDPDYCD